MMNLHPLLNIGRNIVTKDEKNVDVLNAFFPLVFSSKIIYVESIQPSKVEDGDREKNEAPTVQGGIVSDPFKQTQVYGPTHKGGVRSALLGTLLHLPEALINQGVPSGLEVHKCDAHLQKGLEGGSGEPLACQPFLSAGEGHGVGHLECHHTSHTGQQGGQAQTAWVYERQVLLDQLVPLL